MKKGMRGSVLDRESILQLLNTPNPLLEGYPNLEAQIQPNGFDMTLREVLTFTARGEMPPSGAPAVLPDSTALPFDSEGYLHLPVGSYLIILNEIVNLPGHVMALARPRSSLLRSGVAIHTAVWDAGYRGRSQAMLTVYNLAGYRVAREARVMQMVFMYLARPSEDGYRGRYQGENL